jgi:hypothetical protein
MFYNLQTNWSVEFNMVLPSTSHGLEITDILGVLEQSSDEEVHNCDSG